MIATLSQHFQKNLPMVVYRYPGEQHITAILQNDSNLKSIADTGNSGFLIAPFQKSESSFCIVQDEIHVLEEDQFSVGTFKGALEHWHIPENKGYKAMVRNALKHIGSNGLKKVVVSARIPWKSTTDPLTLFTRMLRLYPGAFCYFWHHPQKGTWLGASPEALVREHQGKVKIMSLAGTKTRRKGALPKWSAKEEEEQQLVTRYIEVTAQKHLKDLHIQPREIVRAGNLFHLKTMIHGTLKTKLDELISALHPTPAVAGVPLQEALLFIKNNEDYPREFYTGYLGEVRMGDSRDTALYVNLRCLQWFPDHVEIYVGGGITFNSEVEEEWKELVAKSKTMAAILDY